MSNPFMSHTTHPFSSSQCTSRGSITPLWSKYKSSGCEFFFFFDAGSPGFWQSHSETVLSLLLTAISLSSCLLDLIEVMAAACQAYSLKKQEPESELRVSNIFKSPSSSPLKKQKM